MKKASIFALTIALGTFLSSPGWAQQTPAASAQQTATSGTQQASPASTAQTKPATTATPQASAPKIPPTKTGQSSAAKSGGVYRRLKPSDGIDFAAYADSVEGSSGGRPSGVLKRFALVGKEGQLIELELADTHYVDGRIKTKLFGDILVSSTNLLQFQYQLTESQIRNIKRFLATQPAKPNAQQASTSGTQQTPASSAQQAAPPATGSLFLGTDKDKVSYAVGMNIGKSLKRDGVDVDSTILLRAMQDEMAGDRVLMTDQEAQATLTQLQADMRKAQEVKQQQFAEANKKEGDEFLATNKTKEGVVTLPDGLQYKILQEGTGPRPTVNDAVTVNYRGTLLSGIEFDSSFKRGQPATFNVGGIIKGWTEALQLMPVGSKWQLFIPGDLAYGPRQAGPTIGPNSTLVFEVELLSIQPKAAPAPTPVTAPASNRAPSASPVPTPTRTPKAKP